MNLKEKRCPGLNGLRTFKLSLFRSSMRIERQCLSLLFPQEIISSLDQDRIVYSRTSGRIEHDQSG